VPDEEVHVITFARLSLAVSAAALCALPAFFLAAQQQVGVTSTTAGEPRGTPPAQNERILRVGIDISANERVRTGANDRAHLVFLDGTSLTVGVDSDLVIDRYVYDPGTQKGDLAMTATRGAFRFVGGAISKKSEVVVKTPSAEIGVRGAIVLWTIAGNGSTTATNLYSEYMKAHNPLGTQTAIRFGSQIFIPFGGPPAPPFVLPPGSLQAYNKLFEQSQTTGNILSPADRAMIEALLAGLNQQHLPYADNPDLGFWLAYLEMLANQGISTTNANRRGPQPPTNVAPPPPPPTGCGNC
jgi:hypothetical protein